MPSSADDGALPLRTRDENTTSGGSVMTKVIPEPSRWTSSLPTSITEASLRGIGALRSPDRWVYAILVIVAAIVVGYPVVWLIGGMFGLPDAAQVTDIVDTLRDPATAKALENTLLLAVGAGVLS